MQRRMGLPPVTPYAAVFAAEEQEIDHQAPDQDAPPVDVGLFVFPIGIPAPGFLLVIILGEHALPDLIPGLGLGGGGHRRLAKEARYVQGIAGSFCRRF